VQILCYVLSIAIFIRVILSWVMQDTTNPIYVVMYEITEPILAPIRSVINQIFPGIGRFDLSPIAAGFLLLLVARAAERAV
jgi:YggT family protein